MTRRRTRAERKSATLHQLQPPEVPPPPRWEPPAYVSEGMLVVVPLNDGSGKGEWATVDCAAGYQARVVLRRSGESRWYRLEALRVRSDGDGSYANALDAFRTAWTSS